MEQKSYREIIRAYSHIFRTIICEPSAESLDVFEKEPHYKLGRYLTFNQFDRIDKIFDEHPGVLEILLGFAPDNFDLINPEAAVVGYAHRVQEELPELYRETEGKEELFETYIKVKGEPTAVLPSAVVGLIAFYLRQRKHKERVEQEYLEIVG